MSFFGYTDTRIWFDVVIIAIIGVGYYFIGFSLMVLAQRRAQGKFDISPTPLLAVPASAVDDSQEIPVVVATEEFME